MTRILLIEDDDETAEEVSGYLRNQTYDVVWAATGSDGQVQMRAGPIDVLILDRLLPDMDGLSILAGWRRDGIRTPAIVVSALSDVDHRIEGLRAGGDDYLVKPFSLAELAARIEALLRRPVIGSETVLRVGSLHVDLVARSARLGPRDLELLPREFRLLEYMMRRVGQTITRGMLFEDVWNYNFLPKSNLVDVHMGRLRRKLAEPGEDDLIANVRGTGFVLRHPK